MAISIFCRIFDLGVAIISDSWHLASHFARPDRHQSFCEKLSSNPKVSRVIGIFAFCRIWASELSWLRNCAICHFLWMDLVSIKVYTNVIKIAHMVEDQQRFPYFYIFIASGLP